MRSIWMQHKRHKLFFFHAHGVKTREMTPDPRWSDSANSAKALIRLCSMHLLCTNGRLVFSRKDMPSLMFFLMHIHFPPLDLPATVNSSPSWTRTHMRTQQRLLMSRNAHGPDRSQRGELSLVVCCPRSTVPPNQTMARLAFPATGVLILYSEAQEKRAEGSGGDVGGESGESAATWTSPST